MIDLFDLLCLVSAEGIGPNRIRNLVSRFGSPKAVLEAGIKELSRVDGIDEKLASNIHRTIDRKFAEDQLNRAQKENVRLVSYWDPAYPELLKKIHDPPVLLFVKGNIDEIGLAVAVVGTRSPSDYGSWVAEKLGEDLARSGAVVVSGLARGIDTKAHRGAMKGGGKTMAVLGCGVEVVYPPENRSLFREIGQTGVVLSEFPMGAEPNAVHFPRRNRIISGLSLGTVVVEAGDKSGALITAYMALEQGREVFAVPGNIRSAKSRGTHRLIKEGAKLVESAEDILSEFPQWQKKAGEKEGPRDVLKLLSESERSLWEVLSAEPLYIDKIASEADVTTSEALAVLLSMELKNCVRQLSGMRFVRL